MKEEAHEQRIYLGNNCRDVVFNEITRGPCECKESHCKQVQEFCVYERFPEKDNKLYNTMKLITHSTRMVIKNMLCVESRKTVPDRFTVPLLEAKMFT